MNFFVGDVNLCSFVCTPVLFFMCGVICSIVYRAMIKPEK